MHIFPQLRSSLRFQHIPALISDALLVLENLIPSCLIRLDFFLNDLIVYEIDWTLSGLI